MCRCLALGAGRRAHRAAPGGGGAAPPRTPRAAARGFHRLLGVGRHRGLALAHGDAAKGDFAGVPLNAAARKIGQAWDPAKDEAEGISARRMARPNHAHARPAAHHLAGRHHAQDRDRSGHADTSAALRWQAASRDLKPSWQGNSSAQWEGIVRGSGPPDFLPIALNPREGTRGRSLEVVTTNLRAGYLRKNGVPYSENTTLREYFDLSNERNGDTWFRVTDDRRGSGVSDAAVRDEHELQEAGRRDRVESQAVHGPLTISTSARRM